MKIGTLIELVVAGKMALPRGETMEKYTKLVLIFSLLYCGSAVAQTDLTGTWQGKLAARQNETIQFVIIKQANGSYEALFVSPHNMNRASAVKFAAGARTIDVNSLRSSYSGTVAKDTITGEWRQLLLCGNTGSRRRQSKIFRMAPG